MNPNGRRTRAFRPLAEPCEGRFLLSGATRRTGILDLPGGANHPERPNTPVLPFGALTAQATFIDPSVRIAQPKQITLGYHDFVAPFAALDATNGAIRIGQTSVILDNASLVANPNGAAGTPLLTVGEHVVISYGATVRGAGTIGGFGTANAPTMVGTNAVVEDATLLPGSIVGALAHVTGVTIPSGFRVLPGATITTQAEAESPALGKVARIGASDLSAVDAMVANNVALAGGYTTLYQGQAATGVSGAPVTGTPAPKFNNGNLAAVRGTGQEPGSPAVSFEPSRRGPRFLAAGTKRTVEGSFQDFPARITGGVIFSGQTARSLQHSIGIRDSIRGDEGQPITIGSIARLGDGVVIHAPRGGNLTIGRNFRAGDLAVILGGSGSTIGNDVSVGSRAVVENSKIGAGVTIGDGAYVSGTTLAAGTAVPAGAILVNGVRQR